jgi:YfiH family protein
MDSLIIPDWSLPPNVKAGFTTVNGGFSKTPYQSFNLAMHVNDDLIKVQANRDLLQTLIGDQNQLYWLEQTHSTNSVYLSPHTSVQILNTDAVWTDQSNHVCLVMTADCLPILLCDEDGKTIAAIHAGWKGLVDGILQQMLADLPFGHYRAFIGPAISQNYFEVGEDVYRQILALNSDYRIYSVDKESKHYVDLAAIAKAELIRFGIREVTLSGLCSYEDSRFFSYRRACHTGDKSGNTGRIATLIWKES